MFKNYLLIAIRNLLRNRLYSGINVSGLAIGIACTVLIFLWVRDEHAYDDFHEKGDRLHQVYINQVYSGEVKTSVTTPLPLLEALSNTSSQIKRVSVVNHGEGYLLTAGEKKISKMGTAASEDFLQMFTFQILKGDPSEALKDPKTMVITESVAKALFGEEDPIDKVVKLENTDEFKVGAVIRDVPSQSSLQFDFLLPFSYMASLDWVKRAQHDWNNNSFKTFVELQPGVSPAVVEDQVKDIIRKNNPKTPTAEIFFHPVSKWRLYTEFENGKISGGLIEYVKLFSIIGIFILVIACINFMNMATARSESRAREVGIRKSVGSLRKQLIIQFIGESTFITFIAFLFAMVIVELSLPFYNMLVNKQLFINYTNPYVWLSALLFTFIVGIVAGSYPAFYLSSFKPAKVLKGAIHTGRSSSTPRKVLVTIQFVFSIFLIIGTLVIYQQVMHVKARHIGYDRENLLLIWTTAERETHFQEIREELKQTGAVSAVCKSSAPITRIFSSTDGVQWPGKVGEDKVTFITLATEYDFAETMGVKMLEGRDFSRDFPSDSSAVVINEAALDLMGLKNPIGQKINIWDDNRTIIGVSENIIMGSPFEPADPMALVLNPEWSSTISVRLEPTTDIPTAISKVDQVFKKFDPEHPLWYRFADDEFAVKFSGITLISRLAFIFAALAIIISCLGLFGLAAFTAHQRTKEMGIRKVLGASVTNLVLLLSKDFSRLVVFAFVISAPVAWILMNEFLSQYTYRIAVQWWILPAVGAGVLLLAVVVVSTQALQAASANPVDSLRNE